MSMKGAKHNKNKQEGMKTKRLLRVLTLATLIAFSLQAYSQAYVNIKSVQTKYLTIIEHSGTQVDIEIAKMPALTIVSDSLVATEDSSFVMFSMTKAKNYTVTNKRKAKAMDNLTEGNEPQSTKPAMGNNVIVSKLAAGTMVHVSDAAGNKVAEAQADDKGNAEMVLTSLPQGVYVINTPGAGYKLSLNR